MTLQEFAWLEIGVGLGIAFCLGLLLFNRRERRPDTEGDQEA